MSTLHEHRFLHSIMFSPFDAVSLCGVVGRFPVSGPFLPGVPGFQYYIYMSLLTLSFHRNFGLPLGALPLYLHFHNWSDVFSFISSFDVPKPLQHPPSHNHRYQFLPCFLQDLLMSPVFHKTSKGSPPLLIALFSSLLLPYAFHL